MSGNLVTTTTASPCDRSRRSRSAPRLGALNPATEGRAARRDAVPLSAAAGAGQTAREAVCPGVRTRTHPAHGWRTPGTRPVRTSAGWSPASSSGAGRRRRPAPRPAGRGAGRTATLRPLATLGGRGGTGGQGQGEAGQQPQHEEHRPDAGELVRAGGLGLPLEPAVVGQLHRPPMRTYDCSASRGLSSVSAPGSANSPGHLSRCMVPIISSGCSAATSIGAGQRSVSSPDRG
jgi:hypothetical protein